MILEALAVIATFPYGVKVISEKGMILPFGPWMDKRMKKVNATLRKPLWTCERCMCSAWGVPAAFGVIYGPWWLQWPLILVAAIGAQELLDK